MAAVINTAFPPELWSSCSEATLNDVLTRPLNNLGRCLHNVPVDTLGDPVCGDGIVQGDEVCDCGTPQVGGVLIITLNTPP